MRYPIYIISKGRADCCLTNRKLGKMQVPHFVVVEPQECPAYEAHIDTRYGTLLELPFSNLGQGSIPARNWVWEHSKQAGHFRHWILDDNIYHFVRLNYSTRYFVKRGSAIFAAAEDFVERYENVAIAGFDYLNFAPTTDAAYRPFRLNTRVYSCLLIRNDLRYRWRGKYNEDTDLSLRVLKDGWCTILFVAFLIDKVATLTMRGGNTDNVYVDGDERLRFAKSLQKQHPDVVRIVRRYGRWHHQVNYRPFWGNKLKLKEGVENATARNEYGMKLVKQSQRNPGDGWSKSATRESLNANTGESG